MRLIEGEGRQLRLVGRFTTMLLVVVQSSLEVAGQEAPWATWRLSETRIVIGADGDAESALFGVRDAVLLPGGRIAVAQRGRVTLFGPDGRFLRHIGRPGEGPGEFGSPKSVAWVEDREALRIYDSLQRRVTLMSIEGQILETVPSPSNELMLATDLLLRRDGAAVAAYRPISLAWATRPRPPHPTGPHRDSLVVVRNVGGIVDTLAHVAEGLRVRVGGSTWFDYHPPLGARLLIALGEELVAVGFSDAGSFSLYDDSGQIVARATLPGERQALERNDRRRAVREFLAGGHGGHAMFTPTRQQLEEIAAETSNVRWAPRVDSILFDDEGRLWMRRFSLENSGLRDWYIVSSTGDYVARIALPSRLEVLDIVGSHLIALSRDEFEVETIERYEISR